MVKWINFKTRCTEHVGMCVCVHAQDTQRVNELFLKLQSK